MSGKDPSPFNPRDQMAHFLRAMGFQEDVQSLTWTFRSDPGTLWSWTQEELERAWASAHPMQQELIEVAFGLRKPRGARNDHEAP